MSARNEVGADSTLIIDGEALTLTDKEWSYNTETAESKFDDGLNPDRGVTQQFPEGSAEYDGRKDAFEKKIVNATEDKFRIIYRNNDGGGFRFKRCVITNISANGPGDDKRNVSFDWEGEEAVPF
jgi:hypothetical protein